MNIPPEVTARIMAAWIAQSVTKFRELAAELRADNLDVWADAGVRPLSSLSQYVRRRRYAGVASIASG